MKILVTFLITESRNVQIVIDGQNKINTYGYNSHELHIFDEVEVRYMNKGTPIVLAKDIIQHVVTSFCVALEKAMKKELTLDDSLYVGDLSCLFSKKIYTSTNESEKKDDIFPQYWVWSSPDNTQTWLYNVDNKIYLEISKTYPWLFSEPEENEHYISFDKYINNYQSIACIQLQETRIRSWIDQCQDILQKMKMN